MAVVTRYFSTAAAGSGDGTSWANRAQFVNAGTYSSVITGFSFAGSDTLHCFLGPGTYSITAALSISPTNANLFILQACDSSGVALAHPDPDWLSPQPEYDTSAMPVIDAGANNVAFISAANAILIGLCVQGSATNSALVQTPRKIERCKILNNNSQTGAACLTLSSGAANDCVLTCTGTSFGAIVTFTASGFIHNCRVTGNDSASSGIREGIRSTAATVYPIVSNCTVLNCESGIEFSSTSAGVIPYVYNNTIYNCDLGIYVAQTSQSSPGQIANNVIVGGSTGVLADFQQITCNNRLRNQATAAFDAAMGNWPQAVLNLLDSGTDADEFVDASGGDYRIKSGSTYHGRHLGAGDQIVAGSSTSHDPLYAGLVF